MFVYLLNRWIMTRRFEQVEAGYVYRRRPDLPGIALSAEERQATLRALRRRYWRHVLLLYGGLIALAAAAALAAAILGFDDRIAMPIGYTLAAFLIVLIVQEQRSWARLPETLYAGRPPVAATVPTGTWAQRYAALAPRRSWPVHGAFVLINGAIAVLLVPRASGAEPGHWLIFTAFAAFFLMAVAGAVIKARHTSLLHYRPTTGLFLNDMGAKIEWIDHVLFNAGAAAAKFTRSDRTEHQVPSTLPASIGCPPILLFAVQADWRRLLLYLTTIGKFLVRLRPSYEFDSACRLMRMEATS